MLTIAITLCDTGTPLDAYLCPQQVTIASACYRRASFILRNGPPDQTLYLSTRHPSNACMCALSVPTVANACRRRGSSFILRDLYEVRTWHLALGYTSCLQHMREPSQHAYHSQRLLQESILIHGLSATALIAAPSHSRSCRRCGASCRNISCGTLCRLSAFCAGCTVCIPAVSKCS